GGVRLAGGTVTLDGCTISGNISEGRGGGIAIIAGTLNVTNSTIVGNIAEGNLGGGGINIANAGTTAPIIHSTIVGNSDTSNQPDSAGGIAKSGGFLTMENTIVALNSAGPDPTAFDNVDANDIDSAATNVNGGSPELGPLQNNGGKTLTVAP